MTNEEYLEICQRLDCGISKSMPKSPVPHGVRDTSMLAYQKLKDTGVLGKQERMVYEYVRTAPHPVTRQEINNGLKIGINAVCGRVNSLIAKLLLEECGRRHCSVTGENVMIVRVR